MNEFFVCIQVIFEDKINICFHLNKRLLQRCPLDYIKSNVIRPVIEQIIANCNLEHRDASASMMAFFAIIS